MRHFWKFPKYTDLYQPLLILGDANIEISQTSLCCEARKLNFMTILPSIKAEYDNYIHFNHTNCK